MEELDDTVYAKKLGKRIKELRKQYKITQSDLGAKANLEKTAIQRMERGYNSTLKTLRKVAHAFGISMSELFNFSEIKDQK